MEEDKTMTIGEIIQEVKVQLEEVTEALRNIESETEEEAWYMLESVLYDMKTNIGETYHYGGGTGWIYELYKLQRKK
jgi:hypothetical protein